MTTPRAVRRADDGDAGAIGRLLHDFNREFGDPAPEPPVLATRIGELLRGGDTEVLLADADGGGAVGVAVLRFRTAIFTPGLESYLAELYIVPAWRGRGLGRALMDAVLELAHDRGADTMEIGVDEPDAAARRLYESLGFTNRTAGGDLMYVYERDL